MFMMDNTGNKGMQNQGMNNFGSNNPNLWMMMLNHQQFSGQGGNNAQEMHPSMLQNMNIHNMMANF